MFTKENFIAYLQEQWANANVHVPVDERIGLSISELVRHAESRNATLETPYLDLWLAVFDELISWKISLLDVLYLQREENERKFNDFEKSIIMILSKIVSDSIAMRHTIIAGYDVQAKLILRSTAEYMELYVAIVDDPPLAIEFAKTDHPNEAKKFWSTHIAQGSIRRRVQRAWERFFARSEYPTASWFANWGRSSNLTLSGLSHPSFAGGLFSMIPLKTKYTDEPWLGIWGDKSEGSVETVSIYAQYAFPIFVLNSNFPFKEFGTHFGRSIEYNEADEFHKHVKYGRSILASAILSLHSESNYQHVYPKFDYSIFGE